LLTTAGRTANSSKLKRYAAPKMGKATNNLFYSISGGNSAKFQMKRSTPMGTAMQANRKT
jgi:hypothetical protein